MFVVSYLFRSLDSCRSAEFGTLTSFWMDFSSQLLTVPKAKCCHGCFGCYKRHCKGCCVDLKCCKFSTGDNKPGSRVITGRTRTTRSLRWRTESDLSAPSTSTTSAFALAEEEVGALTSCCLQKRWAMRGGHAGDEGAAPASLPRIPCVEFKQQKKAGSATRA